MLYGMFGDPIYNLWLFAKLAGENLVVSFGLNTPDATHILLPPQPFIDFQARLFGHVLSPVNTYNLIILLGFVLTFIAAYLLSGKLINNKLVKVITALLITFLPYRLAHSQFHISLSSTQWLIFFIYFLISSLKKPGWKNMLLVGLFGALTILDNYQYGAFAIFTALIVIAYGFVRDLMTRKLQNNAKFYGFSALAGLLILSLVSIFNTELVLSIIHKTGLTNLGPTRSFDELKVYSASWSYYLKPSPFLRFFTASSADYFQNKISTLGTSLEEQVLFLGWIPLILAGVSLFIKKTKDEAATYFALLTIGFVFLILSFAPTVNLFGFIITTPSKFLFEHFPVVRVYARFGFVVGIITMLIAGFALDKLVKKIKFSNLIICLIGILALVEFWPRIPLTTKDTSKEAAIYDVLKNQEPGILVEYPFLPADEPSGYAYLNAQLSHHFPLINFSSTGSEGDAIRKSLLDPTRTETIDQLARIGAKYIIVHQNLAEQLSKKFPAETNNGIIIRPNPQQTELVTCIDSECLYQIKI